MIETTVTCNYSLSYIHIHVLIYEQNCSFIKRWITFAFLMSWHKCSLVLFSPIVYVLIISNVRKYLSIYHWSWDIVYVKEALTAVVYIEQIVKWSITSIVSGKCINFVYRLSAARSAAYYSFLKQICGDGHCLHVPKICTSVLLTELIIVPHRHTT